MNKEAASHGRPVHFEIHAADVSRAVAFYSAVFGWQAEDWSSVTDTPYFGLRTGEGPGIDGAITLRRGANPVPGETVVGGAVLTIQVDSFDAAAERILAAGGTVAFPKAALSGMAWQGYFFDTENNMFGVHEPDLNAK